ncbi:uncharacterized protein MELLADRAFT_113436 [Melampsora larici-populina 98AG31]|uniref:Uncharacterized protein n=1 Tax=Melampsora larici-populina (strain 98AG31 / pathotype 3-4-7) TaxID=747676 RepID=F4S9V5_MELLP|nr:uncharacterized protein MELLADRAFT_113436 [Melampsora larici-populina 98AG31]EGF98595.1 hypothetical protein MELLADRAFT_113436 [Melampsora larici-populina 98AG31]
MAQNQQPQRVTLDGEFTLGDIVQGVPSEQHMDFRRFWTHLVNSCTATITTPTIVCEPFGRHVLSCNRTYAFRGSLLLLPYPRAPVIHVDSTQCLEVDTVANLNISPIQTINVSSIGRVRSCTLSPGQSHWDVIMEHRDYEPHERENYDFILHYVISTWMMTNSPPGTFEPGASLCILGFIASHGPDPVAWSIRLNKRATRTVPDHACQARAQFLSLRNNTPDPDTHVFRATISDRILSVFDLMSTSITTSQYYYIYTQYYNDAT